MSDKEINQSPTSEVVDEAELLARRVAREKEEDERMRRDKGRDMYRTQLLGAFREIYHQSQLTSDGIDTTTLCGGTQFGSNLQGNLRDEKAFKIMSTALSKIPYLRRHHSKDMLTECLTEGKVLLEDGSVDEALSSCPTMTLFLKFVQVQPIRDLIIPPEPAVDTKAKKTEGSKKKEGDKKDDKKEDEKKKETAKSDNDQYDSTTTDSTEKREPTLKDQFVSCSWSLQCFLGILMITGLLDALKGRHQSTIRGDDGDQEMQGDDEIRALLKANEANLRAMTFDAVTLACQSTAADLLLARVHYWVLLAREALGQLEDEAFLEECLHLHRLANVHRLYQMQATSLNNALRILIVGKKEYGRAASLVSISHFPEQAARSTAHCRYLLYKAIVLCIQESTPKSYEDANGLLKHAYRKSPSGPRGAGIRLDIVRMLITTDLLLGKAPNKTIMYDREISDGIRVYRDIAKAVHLGQVVEYHRLLQAHKEDLSSHFAYILIKRHLNQAVVRASLVRIARTYSRIHINDVREKIDMTHAPISETYSIVAKAIADRMLSGVTIDGKSECLISKNITERPVTGMDFLTELLKKTEEVNAIQKELKEALAMPHDEELDDEARLQAAERARKEAEESALRAQDAYYEDDFDF